MILDELNKFPAWKLHKYTQAYEQGKVSEDIFECNILEPTMINWFTAYGSTWELAAERALEKVVK